MEEKIKCYGDLVGKIEELDTQIIKMRAQLSELRGLLVDKLSSALKKVNSEKPPPTDVAFLEIDDRTRGNK
jgi:uncharacterized coiled-coil protein SlyX